MLINYYYIDDSLDINASSIDTHSSCYVRHDDVGVYTTEGSYYRNFEDVRDGLINKVANKIHRTNRLTEDDL